MKRPQLRELLWTTVGELWELITEPLTNRTMPAETQRYHIGWASAIPRVRGLPRGRAARPLISTSFAVASGAQAFRPRRGESAVSNISRPTPDPESQTTPVVEPTSPLQPSSPVPVPSTLPYLGSTTQLTIASDATPIITTPQSQIGSILILEPDGAAQMTIVRSPLASNLSQNPQTLNPTSILVTTAEEGLASQLMNTPRDSNRKRHSRSAILQQAAADAMADPFSPRSTRRRKS